MFKSISMIFNTITEIFTAANVIARTGTKYALQFEAEADIQLAQKKALLLQTAELAEA